MAKVGGPGVSFHDLSSGGHVGGLIRGADWAATPLGPSASWPRSLHNHLCMIFELPTAAIIFWGPDQVQLYNDGYAAIMGPRHPRYLGATFRECWPEAYATIHPWMQRVLQDGQTVEVNRTLVPLTRFGFTEEAYFTFTFSPLRDDDGKIAGILQLVTEVTDAVLGERRSAALYELSSQVAHARTTRGAIQLAAAVLGKYAADLPSCRIHVVGAPGQEPLPDDVARVVRECTLVTTEDGATFAAPITAADQHVVAVLAGGVNPQLVFDSHYRGFVQLVCGQLGTLLAAARAHDDERRRVEALAELDRAKTEFFGNVSHELRTPLTLILGPVEDALRDPSRALSGATLEAVHRNAVRLLRLVNTLLDFARLEANRLTLAFEPTDLAALTARIASSFQSLIESAGLALRIDCVPGSAPVHVDRSQWEKIVLNLISNAYKFTFEGQIEVRLSERDGRAHLSVSDTGTGIAPDELPKIFDRFHRVKGARGRSFEGTGIGLALVRELVGLHGGTIEAESEPGRGSRFEVTLPLGTAHLPADSIAGESAAAPAPPSAARDPLVAEAARWQAEAEDSRGLDRVLVADDNADMRAYLRRLIEPRWPVEVVADGEAALAAARARPPALVLSDVMMPGLDGFELLRALRADPRTAAIPVILLSARAGEEAVIDGLETGADDYLIKPFSARELVARIATHLELARKNRLIQAASRQKSEFLANMSHEIRTPLNAIIGFSELIHDRQIPPDTSMHAEFIGHVLGSARHLLRLINDILDLSKVEAGRLELRPEPVELAQLVGEVVAILGAVVAGKQLRVDAEVASGLGEVVVDPGRLKQVLYNFLSNAIKFTPDGGRITVAVRADGDDRFRVQVTDTGAGIAAADLDRLFVEFQQLDAGREQTGSGLGLALTRRLVEAQGGTVGVASTPGVGSTFHAVLPRRTARPVAPLVLPRPCPPGAPCVLVVEDTAEDQHAMVAVLESAGIGVELTATSRAAIARCRQRRFDAIVLDLILPDASGLEVLQQLRADGPNRETRVIVVTVVAEQGALGGVAVHDILRKPFDPRALLASLERAGVALEARRVSRARSSAEVEDQDLGPDAGEE